MQKPNSIPGHSNQLFAFPAANDHQQCSRASATTPPQSPAALLGDREPRAAVTLHVQRRLSRGAHGTTGSVGWTLGLPLQCRERRYGLTARRNAVGSGSGAVVVAAMGKRPCGGVWGGDAVWWSDGRSAVLCDRAEEGGGRARRAVSRRWRHHAIRSPEASRRHPSHHTPLSIAPITRGWSAKHPVTRTDMCRGNHDAGFSLVSSLRALPAPRPAVRAVQVPQITESFVIALSRVCCGHCTQPTALTQAKDPTAAAGAAAGQTSGTV